MNNEKWKLHIGCHRGTLTSRDSEVREFDTKDEALASYQSSRKFWNGIGYRVWFAEITSPNGDRHMLEQNPYR